MHFSNFLGRMGRLFFPHMRSLGQENQDSDGNTAIDNGSLDLSRFVSPGAPRYPELIARQDMARANSVPAEGYLIDARRKLAAGMSTHLTSGGRQQPHDAGFRQHWTQAVNTAEAAYGEDAVMLALGRLSLSKYR